MPNLVRFDEISEASLLTSESLSSAKVVNVSK
jgi:hypothetical protein